MLLYRRVKKQQLYNFTSHFSAISIIFNPIRRRLEIIARSSERLAQTKLTQRARRTHTHVCLPLPAAPCERSRTGDTDLSLPARMKLSIHREETSPGYQHRNAGNGPWPLRKSVKGSPRLRAAPLRKGSGCHVTAVFAGYTELGVWYTRPWKAQCSMGYQNSGATSA